MSWNEMEVPCNLLIGAHTPTNKTLTEDEKRIILLVVEDKINALPIFKIKDPNSVVGFTIRIKEK